MRVKAIQETRQPLCGGIQTFSPKDISQQIRERSVLLPHEPARRLIARLVSLPLLRLLQPLIRMRADVTLNMACDFLCIEDRFGTDASLACLLRRIRRERIERVLIPGCYVGGEDVQFWLRRGAKQLEGIDVYCLQQRWDAIAPQLECHFGAQVCFRQASIEAMPFPDESFDLLATRAVLEHVRNLGAMVNETARVLRTGGFVWHCLGPLYYSFGADHCISAYGDAAGYDHLLLDEQEYQQRIRNQAFFDQQSDSNLPFWALNQQFSFATAADYLDLFQKHFDLEMVIAKVSAKGLAYRRCFPQRWSQLLAAGVTECDLLIKGLAVVLRKK
jgi:SAM-dependent methyltransferase